MSGEIEVDGTVEALEYLEEIAVEMMALFGISRTEAAGRITRQFAPRGLLSEMSVNNLLHEDPETWAKHIYYGRNSHWWVEGSNPMALPYP